MGQGSRSTPIAQLEAEAIVASASLTVFDGSIQRYGSLRFFLDDIGAGTMTITVDWKTAGGASILPAPETIVLVSDYLEVPVRAPNAEIVIAETGTTNPILVSGVVIGVET